MKKFLVIVIVILVIAGGFIFYKNQQDVATINGKNLTLKFSTCGMGAEVCMNEYYLKDEYDNNWTELFTIVYSPLANDPQKIAETLKYSAMMNNGAGSNLFLNDKDNSALVEFGIMYYTEKGEPAIEQNTAKVMNYPYGDGVIVQQYARRYIFDRNRPEAEIKKDLREFNDTYLKVMEKLPAREVYMKPLQKW